MIVCLNCGLLAYATRGGVTAAGEGRLGSRRAATGGAAARGKNKLGTALIMYSLAQNQNSLNRVCGTEVFGDRWHTPGAFAVGIVRHAMFVVTKQIGVTLCSEISLPGRLSPFTVGHHLLTMQVFSSDSSDGEAASVRIGRIARPVGNSAIQVLHGLVCQIESTTLTAW